MAFRDELKIAMDKAGVTNRQLARQIQAGSNTIQRWLAGKSEPSKFIHPFIFEWLAAVELFNHDTRDLPDDT